MLWCIRPVRIEIILCHIFMLFLNGYKLVYWRWYTSDIFIAWARLSWPLDLIDELKLNPLNSWYNQYSLSSVHVHTFDFLLFNFQNFKLWYMILEISPSIYWIRNMEINDIVKPCISICKYYSIISSKKDFLSYSI